MRDFMYIVWALILGGVAFFTGEIVTFVMLGLILIALNNISKHLSDIKLLLEKDDQDEKGDVDVL